MTDSQWQIDRFKDNAPDNPMNPEVKKLLVEALRSGEYRQTKGYLQVTEQVTDRAPGFCCLGVLSELARDVEDLNIDVRSESAHNGVVLEYFSNKEDQNEYHYERSRTDLIETITEWSGINDLMSSCLMGMNDNGVTFVEIADLIEEYL